MPWKNRYIGNPALSGIGMLLFHCPVSDFHCGLRGYSLDAFRRMDLRTTGMEFASEMVIKATLLKLRIAEVPTTLSPDGRSRAPHLRPWRDGWRHLRFMLLCSPRWLFLYPGLLMITAGLATGAWLLPGRRELFGLVLDIHTLLYAAISVVVGFQAVTFALFARVFAVREGVLPRSPRLDWLLASFNLDLGVLLGLILVVTGIAGSLETVLVWRSHQYGPLDPSATLRLVIPSLLSFTLGCQVVLSSFFMSVLGLGVRK
jgi:hypothetical protein